jgi:hypothetical protein
MAMKGTQGKTGAFSAQQHIGPLDRNYAAPIRGWSRRRQEWPNDDGSRPRTWEMRWLGRSACSLEGVVFDAEGWRGSWGSKGRRWQLLVLRDVPKNVRWCWIVARAIRVQRTDSSCFPEWRAVRSAAAFVRGSGRFADVVGRFLGWGSKPAAACVYRLWRREYCRDVRVPGSRYQSVRTEDGSDAGVDACGPDSVSPPSR